MQTPRFFGVGLGAALFIPTAIAASSGCAAASDARGSAERSAQQSSDLKFFYGAPATTTEVQTSGTTRVGAAAFSANGRIQPKGRPTTFSFEYGPTSEYGAATPAKPLAPKLSAHYHENWDKGLGGWKGGMTETALVHHRRGGTSKGFVRFTTEGTDGDDTNHFDGIGIVQLTQYLYAGSYRPEDNSPHLALGGGALDLRDAKVELDLRGRNWIPRNTEIAFWFQNDLDLVKQNDSNWERANWALSGTTLTDHLASGQWEHRSYQLTNDTRVWSYAGNYGGREAYRYIPLDDSLASANTNIFHQMLYVHRGDQASGAIDYDELDITYRNHNVLAASNGGTLIALPGGSLVSGGTEGELAEAMRLTDGWRNGADRTWKSAENPTEAQEFIYALENPVEVNVIQIHQNPQWQAKDVAVLLSEDGERWEAALEGRLPRTIDGGENFNFLRAYDLTKRAKFVKVQILSGYRRRFWGLGEIEVFGKGAIMQTDDDWYNVNADIPAAGPGETMHYRLVAESDGVKTYGEDMTYAVPSDNLPVVSTLAARSLRNGKATLEGRMNPMGLYSEYTFEWGLDATYGNVTVPDYGGIQLTPRHATRVIEGLEPGQTYHFRFVVMNDAGTIQGEDRTFVAQ